MDKLLKNKKNENENKTAEDKLDELFAKLDDLQFFTSGVAGAVIGDILTNGSIEGIGIGALSGCLLSIFANAIQYARFIKMEQKYYGKSK